jgi:exodeoxyribonuclease-5
MREELDRLKALTPGQMTPEIRDLLVRVHAEEKRLASPLFTLRSREQSTLTGNRLCVVDESSMISEQIGADLTGFGVPILAIGDPMQLPPVDGTGWLGEAGMPGATLTEVHRSALDSPVTRIATTVRHATSGERGYGVTGVDGASGRIPHLDPGALTLPDQVLCGTNATRWQGIRLIRKQLGRPRGCPVSGDRIVILSNSGELDIYNGQQFMVLASADDGTERYDMTLRSDDDGSIVEIPVWRYGFQGQDGETRARAFGIGDVAAASYAYVITVHKAQGSQWPRVLVIDESHVFDRMQGTGQRWLYTAVTRASEQVVITGTGIVREG